MSPEVLGLIESFPEAQIDLRLSAAKGKVRANPSITVNGGPQPMMDCN
jgi:hypothetical protein